MGLSAHTICLCRYIDFCGMCGYYCKAGCGGQAAAESQPVDKMLPGLPCNEDKSKQEVCLCVDNKFMLIHTGQIRSQNCSQNCICPLLHTHKAHEAHTKVQVVRYCFSNIHIFHDVHQYNKTLIDLHYNYFMYLSFSFSLLSLAFESTLLRF